MKTIFQSRIDFDKSLSDILASVKEKAINQYKYNLDSNIPDGIMTLDDAAEHAIEHGLVSSISNFNNWDTDKATRFAHHILEDSNCHTEAKGLVKFIPEYK